MEDLILIENGKQNPNGRWKTQSLLKRKNKTHMHNKNTSYVDFLLHQFCTPSLVVNFFVIIFACDVPHILL
jgi:hypothetical protein